jgi:hypothetical protein
MVVLWKEATLNTKALEQALTIKTRCLHTYALGISA